MLGYITAADTIGEADLLIAGLAKTLQDRGVQLAGAVQTNIEVGPDRPCDMDLSILGLPGPAIRISQSLGACAEGCRLDTGALQLAVGKVETALRSGADLLILNKFGKQEAYGRGFREIIGLALEMGVPVLTYVPADVVPSFLVFAGDLAVEVPHDEVESWCLDAIRDAVA